MRKKFRRGVAEVLSQKLKVGLSCFATTAALTPAANASILVEPMIGAGYGTSSAPSLGVNGGSATTLDGGLRFGALEQDYFSALEAHYLMGSATGGSSAYGISFGVVAGYNMDVLPLRFTLGFNFSDSMSASDSDIGGSSFTAGIGYFLDPSTAVNLTYTGHRFDSITNKGNQRLGGTILFNVLTLSLSMPFDLTLPKERWRRRYQGMSHGPSESASSSNEPVSDTPPESLPPPPEETPEALAPTTEAAPEPPSEPATQSNLELPPAPTQSQLEIPSEPPAMEPSTETEVQTPPADAELKVPELPPSDSNLGASPPPPSEAQPELPSPPADGQPEMAPPPPPS